MNAALSRTLAVVAALIITSAPASAIPVFAQKFGVSCETCHTVVPRLNAFGESFKSAGYRWPAPIPAHTASPIAVKTNLAYSSEPDPSGLPKGIVDEVELLLMQPAGKHVAYRVEQYVVDGGVPGKTRDAYVEYNSDPMAAWHGSQHPVLDVQAGQFTLPLPVDPETFRPTENHYAIFDQTVGANPFNLFDDRIGINAGATLHGAELHLLALKGHDPQSGLPSSGTDLMQTLRLGTDAFSLAGYAYTGRRDLGPVADTFSRRGVALTSVAGKARTSLLMQTGNDSSADGLGTAARSSGGFVEEEWAFSNRLIGAARYDAVDAPDAFARSTTVSLSYRLTRRSRFTVEDVAGGTPRTHALNVGFLFAY